jgi:DNA repair exonuclease SbcCD ATPase subunit
MTSEFNVDHYIGHYTGLIEMFQFIMMSRDKIEDRAIIAAKERLIDQYKTAIYEYEMLPSEQRHQPMFIDPILDFLSGILYTPLPVYIKTLNKHKKAISKERKEIDNLQRKLLEKQEKLEEEREQKKQVNRTLNKVRGEKVRLNRELTEAREEIEAIRRSKTYLAGKAITFIPSAIRRLFHSINRNN